MIKAGYSPVYATHPHMLTEGQKFQERANKVLNDQLLLRKHKLLLVSPKIIRRYVKGDLETQTEEIDSQAISKGLDMAYKLKGRYAPEKHQNTNLNASVKDLLDALQNNEETTHKPDSTDTSAIPRDTTE